MTPRAVHAGIPETHAGDRLRMARETIGADRKAFADLVGIDRGALQRYEDGTTKVKPVVLRAIAMATGVDRVWLETGKAPTASGEGLGLPDLDSNQEPAGNRMAEVIVLRPSTRAPRVEAPVAAGF